MTLLMEKEHLMICISLLLVFMAAESVIQWNCRGLLNNLDDIYDILSNHKPNILCLQETHLRPSQTNFLTQYTIFRKDRLNYHHPSGGVAIIVQKSVACQHLQLQTSLEAVAVRAIIFDRLITVCSLYIPPDYRLSSVEFENLTNELPEPYLIIGDFNAHNPLWGSARADARGRLIEKFITSSGSCIFNKKHPTYYNTAHNTYSAIDLAIGSAILLPTCEWKVINNPYGSDHFPVKLLAISNNSQDTDSPRTFKQHAADWKTFKELSRLTPSLISHLDVEAASSLITAHILDCAQKSIPETTPKTLPRPRPWWNEECKRARSEQNKAWALLRRYPTADNLLKFKRAKAKGKRTRRLAKNESWTRFISSINSYTDSRKVWTRIKKLKGYKTNLLPL